MQTTSHILMIQPVQFTFNEQTAVNNAFQSTVAIKHAQEKALNEFNAFVKKLQAHGIDVTVVKDTAEPHTPDSIFPNNWISFHIDGTILLYPMFAENRRLERKQHVIDAVKEKFKVTDIRDLTVLEAKGIFLEGTGSMVLDRENRIAYACLSPRTDKNLFETLCEKLNYTPVSFIATDAQEQLIYHTNVMMCVANQFVVICLDAIANEAERKKLIAYFEKTKKTIIEISLEQMNHFAGNMLQVNNSNKDNFLVMSSQAFYSLTQEQINNIEQFNPIIYSDIKTIETNGGGSARCMMAEIFLPIKQ